MLQLALMMLTAAFFAGLSCDLLSDSDLSCWTLGAGVCPFRRVPEAGFAGAGCMGADFARLAHFVVCSFGVIAVDCSRTSENYCCKKTLCFGGHLSVPTTRGSKRAVCRPQRAQRHCLHSSNIFLDRRERAQADNKGAGEALDPNGTIWHGVSARSRGVD